MERIVKHEKIKQKMVPWVNLDNLKYVIDQFLFNPKIILKNLPSQCGLYWYQSTYMNKVFVDVVYIIINGKESMEKWWTWPHEGFWGTEGKEASTDKGLYDFEKIPALEKCYMA